MKKNLKTNKLNNRNEVTIIPQKKTPNFEPSFKISTYTIEKHNFLTIINFQNSHINQKDLEQLANFLFKYPNVIPTSKFDMGNIYSS